MLRVGFEPMIPVFERAKTVHALHRAAIVIGSFIPLADSNSRSQSLKTVLALTLEVSIISQPLMVSFVKCFSLVGGERM
jgi:hypothetical protein